MTCRSPCISLNNNVNAIVALNEMQITDIGIKLVNNSSIIYGNKI